MAEHTLSSLDAQGLSARLRALGDERRIQVEFLRHLDEFDRRRTFVELGYPSLWEFCLRALHLREGAAGRRIGAMRVLRRFPGLASALKDGRLCLSTLSLLGQVLTDANLAEVTARAAFKTKAEVEQIVASLRPRGAPTDGLRRLPGTDAASSTVSRSLQEAIAQPLHSGEAAKPEAVASVPRLPEMAAQPVEASVPAPRPSELRPVAEGRWSLRVTLDEEGRNDFELLTQLLAHKFPNGDIARVLKEALRCAIEKHGKRKGAVKPATAGSANECANPASIPAEVRRQVWARDGGCCSFVAPDGTRCGSRWMLELDHVRPRALGGPSTIENLRLRCRAHNLLHAEQTFGGDRMQQFRRGHHGLTRGAGPGA